MLLPRRAGFSFLNVAPFRDAFHSPLTKLLNVSTFSLSTTDINKPPQESRSTLPYRKQPDCCPAIASHWWRVPPSPESVHASCRSRRVRAESEPCRQASPPVRAPVPPPLHR